MVNYKHNSNRFSVRSAWIVLPALLGLGWLSAGCTSGPLVAKFDDPVLDSQVNIPVSTASATPAAAPAREPAVVTARPADSAPPARAATPDSFTARNTARPAAYAPPAEPVTPVRRDRDELFAPQATSMFLASPPAPSAQAKLERIAAADCLVGSKRFSAGAIVTAVRNQKGQLVVTLEAVGQNKVVLVPGEADFYALSFRPDVIVMHDRSNLLQDTIRIFNFSPSGVRERWCGHGSRAAGFRIADYSDFKLTGRQISVTEHLSGNTTSDRWPTRRTYGLPLD